MSGAWMIQRPYVMHPDENSEQEEHDCCPMCTKDDEISRLNEKCADLEWMVKKQAMQMARMRKKLASGKPCPAMKAMDAMKRTSAMKAMKAPMKAMKAMKA